MTGAFYSRMSLPILWAVAVKLQLALLFYSGSSWEEVCLCDLWLCVSPLWLLKATMEEYMSAKSTFYFSPQPLHLGPGKRFHWWHTLSHPLHFPPPLLLRNINHSEMKEEKSNANKSPAPSRFHFHHVKWIIQIGSIDLNEFRKKVSLPFAESITMQISSTAFRSSLSFIRSFFLSLAYVTLSQCGCVLCVLMCDERSGKEVIKEVIVTYS